MVGTIKWKPSYHKNKLPLLLTLFAIHCLTKASAFVPQCETYGISKWEPANETSKWEPSNRKKKLPLLLTLFAIHCLTKASAFVPQCKNIWSQQLETSKWEAVTGNQQMGTIKSQKETSPLAHFVHNSLPHKSFRFCSPMQKHMEPATGNQQMKPANGNHQIAKRNFPSCSLCSQFTASQKLPLLFPNAKTYGASNWEPVTGNQQMGTIKSQKETSPLAHFVRNSLPHKSFRFCSPMLLW